MHNKWWIIGLLAVTAVILYTVAKRNKENKEQMKPSTLNNSSSTTTGGFFNKSRWNFPLIGVAGAVSLILLWLWSSCNDKDDCVAPPGCNAPAAITSGCGTDCKFLQVNSGGAVHVVPDTIAITTKVKANAGTSNDANTQLEAQVQAMKDEFVAAGVLESDIYLDDIKIHDISATEWVASQNVKVKTTFTPDQVNAIIHAAGLYNSVFTTEWSLSATLLNAQKKLALDKAIKCARKHAGIEYRNAIASGKCNPNVHKHIGKLIHRSNQVKYKTINLVYKSEQLEDEVDLGDVFDVAKKKFKVHVMICNSTCFKFALTHKSYDDCSSSSDSESDITSNSDDSVASDSD